MVPLRPGGRVGRPAATALALLALAAGMPAAAGAQSAGDDQYADPLATPREDSEPAPQRRTDDAPAPTAEPEPAPPAVSAPTAPSAPATPADTLPRTGAEPWALAALGVFLCAAGTLLRPRARHAEP